MQRITRGGSAVQNRKDRAMGNGLSARWTLDETYTVNPPWMPGIPICRIEWERAAQPEAYDQKRKSDRTKI